MCRTKNIMECNNIVASLDASWLSLTETRPGSCERAGFPELPGRGDACICSVAKAVERELVSDLVEFAVGVAYVPGTACLGELLTHVVAFSEQIPEVAPMAPPAAGHLHDYEDRVKFKDQ